MWGHYIIQDTLPAEDPVILGTLWYDDITQLLKVCTAVSPYAFTSLAGGGGPPGTVTSVGITVPTLLSVSGTPVTTSGTFAVVWAGVVNRVPFFSAAATLATSASLEFNGARLTVTTAVLGKAQYRAAWDAINYTELKVDSVGVMTFTAQGTAPAFVFNEVVSLAAATAAHGAVPYSTATILAYTAVGVSGQVLTSQGAAAPIWTTPTTGTVTSVAMTVPTGLSVSGSPITTSGTLAVTLTAGYMIPGGGSAGQVLQSAGASAPTFSTATYPATATGTGTILRADGTNWVATTATYPTTITVNQVLYATATNVIGSHANLTFDSAILTVKATVAIDTSAAAVAPLTIKSNATTDGYTITNSGFVWKNAAGAEMWRIMGSDPNPGANNYGNLLWGYLAGANISASGTATNNLAQGWSALASAVTGVTGVFAQGFTALFSMTSGSADVVIGSEAAYAATVNVNNNVVVGDKGATSATGLSGNALVGASALRYATAVYDTVAIGNEAARNVVGGGQNTGTTLNGVYVGIATKAATAGRTNEIVIGHAAEGAGDNTATWGNTSITNHYFSGAISAGSLTLTTPLALASGGTAANLTAAHGAVAYSTAAALALTAVGNSGELLTSAGAGAPTWSTKKLAGLVFPLSTNYVSGTGTAGVDNTAQTVKTIAMAANTLTQVGDRLRIRVFWRPDTGTAIVGTLKVNAVTVSLSTSSTAAAELVNEAWLEYIDATHANIIAYSASLIDTTTSAVNVASFAWGSSQDIIFTQTQISNNKIVVYSIVVDIFPKGVA
jgi:hypothetical protein